MRTIVSSVGKLWMPSSNNCTAITASSQELTTIANQDYLMVATGNPVRIRTDGTDPTYGDAGIGFDLPEGAIVHFTATGTSLKFIGPSASGVFCLLRVVNK